MSVFFWAVTTSVKAQVFTRVTEGVLVTQSDASSGASWGDYDNDGNLDLFVANMERLSAGETQIRHNRLYRNNGDGTFSEIVDSPVVRDNTYSASGIWGDYDNDGFLDLYVSNRSSGLSGGALNLFYHNNGDGTFSAVEDVEPAQNRTRTWSSSWGDYDNDGFLDLFVSGESQGTVNQAAAINFVYHNKGDGTFATAFEDRISLEARRTFHGTWVDLDGDRDLDLFVPNQHFAENQSELYRNQLSDGGTFVLETNNFLMTRDESNQYAATWADYDNDGDADLLVTGAGFGGSGNKLFDNDGSGNFEPAAIRGTISRDSGGLTGVCWGDFDNDGDLDLYSGNGDEARASLHINAGDGSFSALTGSVVVDESIPVTSCSVIDYDNDGDVDLFVSAGFLDQPTTTFNVSHEPFENVLYRNEEGNRNHWVNIALSGRQSNSFGLGAAIRVRARVGGAARTQTRWLSGNATGDRGQSGTRAHFGLGDAEEIEEIHVVWPSGVEDVLQNVAADQFLVITEGETAEDVGREHVEEHPTDITLLEQFPNPLQATATIRYALNASSFVSLTVYDLLGQPIQTLVGRPHTPGVFEVEFDGTALPSGVYLYRLQTEQSSQTRRLTLVR